MGARAQSEEFTVIVGMGVWAKGDSLKQAKARFYRQGGRFSQGYTVHTFPPGSYFQGVELTHGDVYTSGAPAETRIVPPMRRRADRAPRPAVDESEEL